MARAFAAAIELARSSARLVGREDLGLGHREFARLIERYFPGRKLKGASGSLAMARDEFEDLLGLLLEHRADDLPETRWLAHAIAVCCVGGDDHLWQDLGMPDRQALSGLLARYFPGLFAQNTQNMRWKKFFYKQLCARQGLSCRSPNCRQCSEYSGCFGPEEESSS